MSDLVQQIVEDFARLKWKADPYAHFEELTSGAPERLGEFLHAALSRWPDGGTFFADVISFTREEELARLVPVAMDCLEAGRSTGAAETLLAACSEQAPALLHPYLDRIFRLKPNGRTYYAGWPWRESGGQHLEFLRAKAGVRNSPDRDFALDALAEVRTEEALRIVLQERECDREPSVGYCRAVGFEPVDATFRQLYPVQPWHLVFSPGYFGTDERPVHLRHLHPTWRSVSVTSPGHRFGGCGNSRCAGCGEANHHLLTFDASVIGSVVGSRQRLTLEVCLSCLGWEAPRLTYRHDAAGNVTGEAVRRSACPPQFPAGALKEDFVRLEPAAPRWRWQDWGLSNSRQNLHRLGGHPCWVQDAEYPTCPDCGRTMIFLLQLDSNLPDATGGEWLWGSGGIGYVCWCDSCAISSYSWQCT